MDELFLVNFNLKPNFHPGCSLLHVPLVRHLLRSRRDSEDYCCRPNGASAGCAYDNAPNQVWQGVKTHTVQVQQRIYDTCDKRQRSWVLTLQLFWAGLVHEGDKSDSGNAALFTGCSLCRFWLTKHQLFNAANTPYCIGGLLLNPLMIFDWNYTSQQALSYTLSTSVQLKGSNRVQTKSLDQKKDTKHQRKWSDIQ